jgi:hypothetical protein
LFSDSPLDEVWLTRILTEAGLDRSFTIRRMDAEVLIFKVAADRGLDAGGYAQAKTVAARLAPRVHRAEADARNLAVLWNIVSEGNVSDGGRAAYRQRPSYFGGSRSSPAWTDAGGETDDSECEGAWPYSSKSCCCQGNFLNPRDPFPGIIRTCKMPPPGNFHEIWNLEMFAASEKRKVKPSAPERWRRESRDLRPW